MPSLNYHGLFFLQRIVKKYFILVHLPHLAGWFYSAASTRSNKSPCLTQRMCGAAGAAGKKQPAVELSRVKRRMSHGSAK